MLSECTWMKECCFYDAYEKARINARKECG